MTASDRSKAEQDRDNLRQSGHFDLHLMHAGRVACDVGYECAGPPGAPLLVVGGGISAGRHVLANPLDRSAGWWETQASLLRNYRVLAIDWLGADGALDLPLDSSDQANAILRVMDELEVAAAAAFIGASYGAMVGMHCVARTPERFGKLLALSAAHRAHPMASAQRALQRQAIEWGERLGQPEAGVALARKLAILTYRTAEEFGERFAEPTRIVNGRGRAHCEDYLDHMGDKHGRRMSAVAYRRLSESIDCHRIDPAAITLPATFVAIASDQLVPRADIEHLAEAVGGSRLVTLASRYGHDAFLKEDQAVSDILHQFLDHPELAS